MGVVAVLSSSSSFYLFVEELFPFQLKLKLKLKLIAGLFLKLLPKLLLFILVDS